MKILILVKLNPFFENAASANRILSLSEGIAKLGVEINFLITGGYCSIAEYKQLGKRGTYKNIKYQYLTLTFNHTIWFRRINIYILKSLLANWASIRIKKIVKQSPEVILWSGSDIDSFNLVTKIKKVNSQIYAFLELSEFMDIHQYNKGNLLQRNIANKRQVFFEKEAFYAYDGIALMTRTLIRHYELFPKPGPKLLHLPMTVDLDRFNQKQPVIEGFEIPYIAFVGVMNDAKEGIDILIRSFAKIHTNFPEYKLYLIGSWNYDTPNHQKMIKEYGLENSVFWKGEFPRSKIPAIIMNASLLVLPRPDSKQAQGGFPTKLGEYLATGNPVCATKVGEIPDYLVDEENAYLATPDSDDSLADAMSRALSNTELAEKIGKKGRKIAETYFNKDVQAQLLFNFLNSNIKT